MPYYRYLRRQRADGQKFPPPTRGRDQPEMMRALTANVWPCNHYLQAIDAFCNWGVSTKRLLANPLLGLERLNNEVDVRHKRRALTAEEVGKLIASARGSGVSIQRFNREKRARISIISFMTGLRRNEIASLTPRSFALDAEQPTVTVEAVSSKRRRKDVLPLHPELVALLRVWLKGLQPTEKLFPQLGKRRTWLMVKKDLERVGIPYENEHGVADFHAAGRHTHITKLLRNGATLPEAKELARHSGHQDDDEVHPHRNGRPGKSRSEPSATQNDPRTRHSTVPGKNGCDARARHFARLWATFAVIGWQRGGRQETPKPLPGQGF